MLIPASFPPSSGGGIGVFLTYATYMKRTQGAVKMGVLTPVLNNLVRLVATQ